MNKRYLLKHFLHSFILDCYAALTDLLLFIYCLFERDLKRVWEAKKFFSELVEEQVWKNIKTHIIIKDYFEEGK